MSGMVHEWLADIRYALRGFAAAPTFTLAATLTFAIGIGANTAIVSVVYALLLRPLPYPAPSRLAFVDAVLSRPEGSTDFQLQYRDVDYLRQSGTALATVVAWTSGWGLALEGTDGAARLDASFVDRGYFDLLGAAPLVGRLFTAGEFALSSDAMVVVLSEPAWRQHFGGDPGVVGDEIRLQGRPFTVVGVLPRSFYDASAAQGETVDAWVPLGRAQTLLGLADLTRNAARNFWAIARLDDGVALGQASAQLDALSVQLRALHPDHDGFALRAIPLARTFFAEVRRPLWTLLAASGFVLLVAAANVAHLLLIRAAARRRELATRLALGAPRRRIVRQQLIEALLLAFGGATLGLAVAVGSTPALVAMSPIDLPGFVDVRLHLPVLATTAIVAALSGVAAALAPVWALSRTALLDALAAAGSSRVAGPSRASRWLAGAELTTAFVVVAGALLMLQSLAGLMRVDLAFRHEQLFAARLELPAGRYANPRDRALFGSRAVERLAAIPGAEQAVLWGPSMFGHSTWVAFLVPDDQLAMGDGARVMVWRHSTSPGALASLGIRLSRGREFVSTDTLDTAPVAVLSASAATRLFAGGDAVGRRFQIGTGATATMVTVVGIAEDVRHRGRFRFSQGSELDQPQLDVYFPYAQRPNGLVTVGVQMAAGTAPPTNEIRRALAEIDPALPLFDDAALATRLRDEEAPVRFAAVLLNVLGAVAIVLAAIGVYGVMAAGVAAAQRELAIRAALGAEPRSLRRRVVGHGLAIALAAVLLGALVAWAGAAAFSAALFDRRATDVGPLAAAAVVLMAATWLACELPARRASRVDPARVLRGD
jgi:putative ABC transport system permease protein